MESRRRVLISMQKNLEERIIAQMVFTEEIIPKVTAYFTAFMSMTQ